jgi:preprotein translocase subunit SecA
VLIGTISVEKNERLSMYLNQLGIEHEILNAKNHEREGEIIAQAGRPGAVTLATNMAGRGVDIKLGGVPADPADVEKVISAGGLFVLGTERHESRRIDNQLRGRAARQGDPGETQFFVSTEDDLMRIFAGDRMKTVMTRLNVPDDMPIEQGMITKLLETAQKKVEGHNFDIRKHLLEYDDVLNRHRTAIYHKRKQILEFVVANATNVVPNDTNALLVVEGQVLSEGGEIVEAVESEKTFSSVKEMIMDMIEQEIEYVVSFHTNTEDQAEWNVKEIFETGKTIFPFTAEEKTTLLAFAKPDTDSKLGDVEQRDKMVQFLLEKAKKSYAELEQHIIGSGANETDGRKMMNALGRSILLRAIDTLWVEHLDTIDYIRKGIGLQGYGQRDPLVEYKKETYHMFNALLANIQKEVVYSFFKINIGISLAPSIMATDKLTLAGATKDLSSQGEHIAKKVRDDAGHKVGRNDPCPCGSGKKFKKCHGA